MPNCTHGHQPQTAALVICPECYRALMRRTEFMEIDKLIAILTACSNRKGNRCSQCPAFGKGDRQCISNAMRAAAVVLKAQDAQLAEKDKQLAAAVALIPHTCHSCGRREGWKTCRDAAFISDGEECLNWTLCGPQEAGEVGHD